MAHTTHAEPTNPFEPIGRLRDDACDGLMNFIEGHPRSLILLSVSLLGLALGGAPVLLAALAVLAGVVIRTNRFSIAVMSAIIGNIFGPAGVLVGGGLGYLSGWVAELMRDRPTAEVVKPIGRVYGFMFGGYITITNGVDIMSGPGLVHWALVLLLYPIIGSFVAEVVVGAFQFIRGLSSEAPTAPKVKPF